MKIWKILILVTGLAGLAGFFLPMAKFTDASNTTTSFSALDIMRGGGNAHAVVGKAEAVGEEYAKKMTERLEAQVETGIMALKGVIAGFFVPALLLTILGGVGVARGKFGRLGGVFALVLGLVSAAIWGIFFLGAKDDASYKLGLGLHALLIAGLGGLVGGLGALIKPDGDRWSGV